MTIDPTEAIIAENNALAAAAQELYIEQLDQELLNELAQLQNTIADQIRAENAKIANTLASSNQQQVQNTSNTDNTTVQNGNYVVSDIFDVQN